MTTEELRAPNQKLRTTTVETATTGPASGDYTRHADTTTTGPSSGEYSRRTETTSTGPTNGPYAGAPAVQPVQPAGVEYVRAADIPAARPGSDYAPRAFKVATVKPSNGEMARRITVFVAGIIQTLIIVRIALLLLDARATNGLVAVVLNVSQGFVAPFQGILNTGTLKAAGSVLDVAAIVALIGWTLIEGLVIAGVAIFRREPV
jgi:hypothetical protein